MREVGGTLSRIGCASPLRAACTTAIILVSVVLAACERKLEPTLSFNETIQPILSENCYGCHGPDSSSRKANLRLDRQESAFAARDKDGAAIVPGQPDKSPLIHRVEAKDEKERMPPPEAHKTLSPQQVAALRQWIKEGAHYEPHWSFIPPTRPAVPESSGQHKEWARNEVDRFILARLEQEQLTPSPEANKRGLIRRVTYDLTGLPPAPEEVEAFVADTTPDAYEKVVDRLLASPRYGEHRAHYWLDYVRYADTHGLHFDNYRAIWPYRDYVIKAYNANKPFDAFVREQLAGDLLPKQSVETLIATGYMRSNPTTHEGGTIQEEVFVNLTRDRVETFGVTFLGLTVGCAACHDHKFDPTSQRDFYQLAAFLNNTADGPMDFNLSDPPPVIRLPDDKNLPVYEKLLSERAELLARMSARRKEAGALLRARLAAHSGPRPVAADRLELRLRFDEGQGEVLRNSAPTPSVSEFKTVSNPIVWGENNWLWPSARFDMNTRLPLGNIGDVEANEAFSVGGWVMVRGAHHSAAPKALFARLGNPNGRNKSGWGLYYQNSGVGFGTGYRTGRFILTLANDSAPKHRQIQQAAGRTPQTREQLIRRMMTPVFEPMERAIQVSTREAVASEQWVHVFVTYDGSRRADGVRLFLNGKPTSPVVLNDSLGPADSIRTGATTHIGRRDEDADVLRETRYQDWRFYRRALSSAEAARLPYEDVAAEIVAKQSDPSKWSDDERFVVQEQYVLSDQDEQAEQLRTEIAALQAKIDALALAPKRDLLDSPTSITGDRSAARALQQLIAERPSSLIAQEKTTPPYAHVLKRGDYAARLERVAPGTPHFLPALAADAPRNRLSLANWLFTAENPLFARVAINRMWQELFGSGLVESAGDFGRTGSHPSHPKLLDWLAVDFRESGWDVKRMYRELVLSATYRQSAVITPALLKADPTNRLLARGPRFRMDAEVIRDSALAVSGLLVNRVGGPPVKPYQPLGLWQEVAMLESNTKEYAADTGEDLYRRSVYSFLKRASPPPSMEAFDATSRETACLRRARANTPLQALVTLNDPQFVEAARMVAQRAMQEARDDAGRMQRLAEIALSRPLDSVELAILHHSKQRFVRHFQARPQDATNLLAVGETRSEDSLNPRELSAWTMVANVFLSLDEFVTK